MKQAEVDTQDEVSKILAHYVKAWSPCYRAIAVILDGLPRWLSRRADAAWPPLTRELSGCYDADWRLWALLEVRPADMAVLRNHIMDNGGRKQLPDVKNKVAGMINAFQIAHDSLQETNLSEQIKHLRKAWNQAECYTTATMLIGNLVLKPNDPIKKFNKEDLVKLVNEALNNAYLHDLWPLSSEPPEWHVELPRSLRVESLTFIGMSLQDAENAADQPAPKRNKC